MTSGSDRRGDAGFGLLVRHPDGDMDRPTALARLIHPLEPEGRSSAVRVDQVLIGTVAARLVTEGRTPERHHLGGVGRPGDDEDVLDGRWVGHEPLLASHRGDCAGHVDIALGHPEVVVRDRDQAHRHAIVSEVDVGAVGVRAGQLADRAHEPSTGSERSGSKEGARSIADDGPVLDPAGLRELPRRDPLAHAPNSTSSRGLPAINRGAWPSRRRTGRAAGRAGRRSRPPVAGSPRRPSRGAFRARPR